MVEARSIYHLYVSNALYSVARLVGNRVIYLLKKSVL